MPDWPKRKRAQPNRVETYLVGGKLQPAIKAAPANLQPAKNRWPPIAAIIESHEQVIIKQLVVARFQL